ncbi:hypothetical protein REB14_19585 [Chryseobacterium sp. ES2]|uniref:DUF6705 domain-containing protein n=1 Tax=Chryseobacterium metallicongregator TaxID=3073042 RepID=A0ABU1E9A3_9FLAO|nr:DUF6705 family protein [Chryseobacterium sp. ES2]MDR4954389.1 hypothetical protein [Chryseobacterium sp. ES2]
MKNRLSILLVFITISCNAQIYPLNYKEDVPNGAYYKDLDGELDKYVGMWKGVWNGKTLYLDLRKNKYKLGDNSNYIYKDMILGERKVINSSGNIEIDRILNFDYVHPEFDGIGFNLKNGNIKRLYFYPKNMCRKTATLDITNFTGNQMTLHFEYLPSIIDPNCQHNAYVDQYGDFPINFPKDIVLTKQ